jgi:hypothetical protein
MAAGGQLKCLAARCGIVRGFMNPLLEQALADVDPLTAERGFQQPSSATLAEAERLLALVHPRWRAPTVEVLSDGAVVLDWDAGAHGWLQLTVQGDGRLVHSAVIEGDDYAQSEPFFDQLPDWADALLKKLLSREH